MHYFLLFRIIPTMLSIQLASFFSGVRFVQGAWRFTKTPPSVLYVSQGDNDNSATFEWDYHVDDRLTEFSGLSPKWSFYEENATHSKAYDIAFENKFRNWKWEISNECPARLLNPTVRVSKKPGSTATLVITNVTTADSGVYGCSLVLKSLPNPETKKTRLVVTVRPQITITGETSVLENTNLTLICLAVGPPTPNVTWMNDAGVVLAQGIGSAPLAITYIARKKNGKVHVYSCTATNNPENPVEKEVNITVKYCPSCTESAKSLNAYLGQEDVELKSCIADGVPTPTHVWLFPNKTMAKSQTAKESTYMIAKVTEKHIGNWTVNITNGIPSCPYILYKLEIVKVKGPSLAVVVAFTGGQIAGFVFGLIIAVGIIGAVIYVIYIKKKENKEMTTLEKALIVIGLIVALAIIVVIVVVIIVGIA